jgi:hypothetical protein
MRPSAGGGSLVWVRRNGDDRDRQRWRGRRRRLVDDLRAGGLRWGCRDLRFRTSLLPLAVGRKRLRYAGLPM